MKNKRELILTSVLELFREHGMNGLKISAIARKADIGKGTIYEYFRSKEDLFIGAFEYGLEQFGKNAAVKLKNASTFQDSFYSLVDCVANIAAKTPFLSMMSDSNNMPFSKSTMKKMKVVMRSSLDSFMEIMSAIIAKGVEEGVIKPAPGPEYLRAMLLIITNMTFQQAHFKEKNFEDLREFYYQVCLKLFA